MLIDIGAGSVAGACARFFDGKPPQLLYSQRVPIESRDAEPHENAMFRALNTLCEALVHEGSGELMRAVGSGGVDAILVSVDAPWQQTTLRTDRLEQKTPFVFTKRLVTEALKKTEASSPGKLLVDESVIGTILNGYETRSPYGKKVQRAVIVVLSSLIDESVARGIVKELRSHYHTRRVLPIAGSSLRYQAMRLAFPHERDALIVDATGPEVAIALVRKRLLVAVSETQDGAAGSPAWVKEVTEKLADLSKRYPLPRTIFLIARESEMKTLTETLTSANLGSLWLSENPPQIVPVLASHLVGLVRLAANTSPDTILQLMALYWQHHNPADEG